MTGNRNCSQLGQILLFGIACQNDGDEDISWQTGGQLRWRWLQATSQQLAGSEDVLAQLRCARRCTRPAFDAFLRNAAHAGGKGRFAFHAGR
jgi:hypothetical protein